MGVSNLTGTSLKVLKVGAINLFVLVVLVEIASVGVYRINTGEFFYSRTEVRANATRAQFDTNFQQVGNDISINYQLHPYFGYVYRQGYVLGSCPTNNFGFVSPYDFPFKRTSEDQFLVGIFGGSVATLFSLHELDNHVLVNALQRTSVLHNKEIVILNFATAAYKQPQQLLVLNYLLSIGQELDMVINIDGFNDVVLSYWANKFSVEMSMPPVAVELPLIDLANKDLSPEELTLTLELLQSKGQLKNALAQLDNCRFATCYTFRWVLAKYFFKRYQKGLEAYGQLERNGSSKDSLVQLNRVEKPLDDSEAYEQIANLWANASLAMKELLSAKRILYFHFIQPNQYYMTGRQFSDEERRIAFDDRLANREAITKGYPKLLSKVRSLQESGVNVFSAVNIFDEVKDIVYQDSCCHYNNFGNEIFANFVAGSITVPLRNSSV
ncbi:MAG: hypothetical protein WAU45_17460 [Blastocatellia bacterium]